MVLAGAEEPALPTESLAQSATPVQSRRALLAYVAGANAAPASRLLHANVVIGGGDHAGKGFCLSRAAGIAKSFVTP